MPQQGPRAALRDQGGRGALLTPAGKLTLAGVGVILGGMVVAIGTRMTWAEGVLRGQPVNAPGLPPIFLGRGRLPLNGSELGAGYLFGLGLLLALIPLGWLVVGPKGRVVLGVAGLALAIGIGAGVAGARADATDRAARVMRSEVGSEFASFRIATRAGSGVAAAGAAIAALSSIAGAVVGRRVPRLRMPEPPDKDTAA